MFDFKKLTLSPDSKLTEALVILDKYFDAQIVLITDASNKLLGTVTDGDIRRGLLAGLTLETQVRDVMCAEFKSVSSNIKRQDISKTFIEYGIKQLPELDDQGRVVDFHLMDDKQVALDSKANVVIMAGGLGTRLSPLTNTCPKPMLKLGDRPILQVIIENMRQQGFKRFYLSINYLGEQISNYFGDGTKFDVQIEYIHEKERLGTAGALGLLPDSFFYDQGDSIILNGDVITNVDFNSMLKFHRENFSDATMCVRDYSMQIPFGEVTVNGNKVLDIHEKPIKNFFVNAGVYVMKSALLKKVEKNKYLDMPDFFSSLIESNSEISAFPIHEYWMDVGQHDQLSQAKKDHEG